jgi:predicted PurR-regulated permease PerM
MLVTGLGVAVALLYYGRVFCITLVVAVILAFLLEPFVALVMRARIPRGLAAFLVCTVALFGLYLAGLALVSQLAALTEDLPEYTQRLNVIVDRVATEVDKFESNVMKNLVPRRFQAAAAPEQPAPAPTTRRKRNTPPPQPAGPPPVPEVRIHQERATLVQSVAEYVSEFYNALLMISFVPFLVYFMLSWRDHISLSLVAIYREGERPRAGRSWSAIASMARAYVVGNVILGIIIAVVTCTVFYTWHLPYWLLVGTLSGFLSLIPYVGLPLAMIPALGSALLTYDAITPYLLICFEVGIIHLLALNLLYPAVVGARVHLNPLVVTVALMFWGTIWGGIGLVLAIPMTAAVKVYLDNTDNLQEYGRLLGDQTPAAPPPVSGVEKIRTLSSS